MRSTPSHDAYFFLFFFNDTATTEIYTLSLHDALPISSRSEPGSWTTSGNPQKRCRLEPVQSPPSNREYRGISLRHHRDRKSTRLNSSHLGISYAVFCLR